MAMVDVDGSCQFSADSQPGLRVGGHPALSVAVIIIIIIIILASSTPSIACPGRTHTASSSD